MPVVPSMPTSVDQGAVVLAMYAQEMNLSSNAFFGVIKSGDAEGCTTLWSKAQRDFVSYYLNEAQDRLEKYLGYPLSKKWYANEQHNNTSRINTIMGDVTSLGIKAVTNIALATPIIHTSDPSVISSIPTSVTDADEISFFQPGTDLEVYPSSLTLSGGSISAEFPRARLVLNTWSGSSVDYADTSGSGAFMQTVDIKRVYTDDTQPGVLVFPMGTLDPCSEETCNEDTVTACGYIYSNKAGTIRFIENASKLFSLAKLLRVNYCAKTIASKEAIEILIHFAHTLMPTEPNSGCPELSAIYWYDRSIPKAQHKEQADSRFGPQEGAYRAWSYTQRARHVRFSFM